MDKQFIAAPHFQGRRQGYYFTRGDRGIGYYRDAHAVNGDNRHDGNGGYKGKGKRRATSDSDDDDDDDGGGGAGGSARTEDYYNNHSKRQRQLVDGNVLLREAEAAAEGEENNIISDVKSLKRAIRLLRKKYEDNASLRVRYPHSPDKFMDSEVSLATEIRKISGVAASPSLLPILFQSQDDGTSTTTTTSDMMIPIDLISLLLSHENTDIAGEVIRMFREITDTEVLTECDRNVGGDDDNGKNSAGLGPVAISIVNAVGSHAKAFVQNLSRLDETTISDQESIDNIVACIENLIESTEADVIEKIVATTKLMKWLLHRINVGSESLKTSNGTPELDGIMAAAVDLLASVLQTSEKARESLTQKDIECMLISLSHFRNSSGKDEEKMEVLESLSSALCSAMLDRKNKLFFTDLEGVELALLLMKVKSKGVRSSATQLLDFALTRNTPACERLVRANGGLGIAFSLFTGKVKYVTSLDSKDSMTSRSVNIIFSLFQALPPHTKERDRVSAKMVENDFEKCDRLVELYFDYKERIDLTVKALQRHAAAISGGMTTEEDIYSARIEGGQYTLQQIAHILAHSYATGHLGIQSRLLMLLKQGQETLKDVRSVLDSYWEEIGDGDGEAAQSRRRERLRALQKQLREPEELSDGEADANGSGDGESNGGDCDGDE